MENEEKDVNVEDQVIPLVDDSIEEGEEEMIAPPEEAELKKQLSQMSQGQTEFQPSVPSSDEEVEEETESPETDSNEEEDPELSQVQIKPVEGETSRERALRKQLKLSRDREQYYKNQQILNLDRGEIEPVDEEYQQLKQTYSDEYLNEMERMFDVIGKKKGFVRQSEVYAKDGNQLVEDFIEKHPEYKAENDPDDARWNLFRDIIGKRYKTKDKNLKEIQVILNKAHRDVGEELGEIIQQRNPNKISAQQQKLRSVSHSGGTKSQSEKPTKAPTDPKIRAMFKGFDDDDF